jgi:hypothetical protein
MLQVVSLHHSDVYCCGGLHGGDGRSDMGFRWGEGHGRWGEGPTITLYTWAPIPPPSHCPLVTDCSVSCSLSFLSDTPFSPPSPSIHTHSVHPRTSNHLRTEKHRSTQVTRLRHSDGHQSVVCHHPHPSGDHHSHAPFVDRWRAAPQRWFCFALWCACVCERETCV